MRLPRWFVAVVAAVVVDASVNRRPPALVVAVVVAAVVVAAAVVAAAVVAAAVVAAAVVAAGVVAEGDTGEGDACDGENVGCEAGAGGCGEIVGGAVCPGAEGVWGCLGC